MVKGQKSFELFSEANKKGSNKRFKEKNKFLNQYDVCLAKIYKVVSVLR